MVVEPFGAQCPISTSVVPIVVARHVLHDIMHSLRRDMREERLDEGLMLQVREIYNSMNEINSTRLRRLSLALPDNVSTC
jgi:hypothetical protein